VDESQREPSLVQEGPRSKERLRDAGLALAWVSAVCTLMVYICETSMIMAMNPGLPGFLFFLYYAGIPVSVPWAAALVARRWQSVAAVLLVVAGLANLGLTLDKIGYPDTMRCFLLPLVLVAPAWLAAALLLCSRLMSPNQHATGNDE
jgi:hypothetical protein